MEEAPELEDFVPQVDTPDEDFLNESLHLDKGKNSTHFVREMMLMLLFLQLAASRTTASR